MTLEDTPQNREQLGEWLRLEMFDLGDEYVGAGQEVDRTGLAENAAQAWNLYADDADATIPEWVFEVAHEIATEFETPEDPCAI